MVVRQGMVMLLLMVTMVVVVMVVTVAMMAVGMGMVMVPAVYWALVWSGPRNAHTISCHPHTRCKMGPIQVNMLIFGAQRGDVTFSVTQLGGSRVGLVPGRLSNHQPREQGRCEPGLEKVVSSRKLL